MKLELLHLWKCPYSAKVRDHISELELEDQIQYREIGEDHEALELLQEKTGGTQVPCLLIDGEPMLESSAINVWLDHNLKPSPALEI